MRRGGAADWGGGADWAVRGGGGKQYTGQPLPVWAITLKTSLG